ncbi:ribosome maturation factor RimM [Methylobacterium sp. NEAU K]|uniref:ribosome maturation factor RimM n=1 Tax=Methylobacterium sp. NEAU K TaxID=3064946 RepID=UPI0027364C01|nr:ribosome maturation factor RimM [Methylobacterium sp. NEAU K]MDP4001975.1 ribosome maturation factor RimM [Methylobacterium sp. NEAU K]
MARRPAGPSPRDGGRRGRPSTAIGSIAPDAATSPKAPAPKPVRPPAAPDPNLVLLGEFGRAHGLNGEVRLKSYTGDPRAIAGYGALLTSDGRTLTLSDVRPAPGSSPDMLIARVKGVGGRNEAEALNRVALFVPRDRLAEPEDDDEVYAADLIGATAVDEAGTTVGTIVAVPNYGGGDLLELRPALGGATALLPFTKAFVPSLDLAQRRVTVVLPEDFFAPVGEKPADDPG